MEEKNSYQTLSSKSHLDILKLFYKKDQSIEQIAETLNLQPINISHHLKSLEEAGLIEKKMNIKFSWKTKNSLLNS